MLAIEGAGVTIATKDWAGGDVPLLLTHGAGMDKRSLNLLVEQLLPTFRVITFDMRNHGQSSEGPWEWPLVTADVEAIRVAYDLDDVVVAGHSLGGMVAAMYAADYPDHVRAAINIDGQGRGKPSNYLGMTEAEVAKAWAALDKVEADQLRAMGPRFQQMMDGRNKIDLFDVWRATAPCPFLLFNCVGDDPTYEAMGAAEMFRAYRSGLERDFAALAQEFPSIEIATVDQTHVGVVLEPEGTASKMATFVSK